MAGSARERGGPKRFGLALGGVIVAGFLRALGSTWRVRTDAENLFGGEPFVGAVWHSELFVAAYLFRDRGAVVPVSRSRDGDRIVAVLRHLGFGASPRGSSSRGAAAALAASIRAARGGSIVGVLCDGPRGPARRAKPGVLAIARASGRPIRPIGFAASPSVRFGSWDRIALPLPFARMAFAVGPPLRVARDADRQTLERERAQLEREIDRQQERARAMLNAPSSLRVEGRA